MQVRDRLQIPVPKVLAYSAEPASNSVGAEYIIMEKCPGIELGRVWDDLLEKQQFEIVRQIATYTARLSKTHFPAYGSLYYSKDVRDIDSKPIDECFSIGPTTSRSWFEDRRAEVEVPRGPCKFACPHLSTIQIT